MYVSPRHPNPPRAAAPPDDDGEVLAAIPRGDGREELRVTLKTYNGHPYVALRVWERNGRGEFWPVKNKGCSVRVSEAEAVAEALRSTADGRRGPGPQADPDRPRFVDRRRPQQARRQEAQTSAWQPALPSLPPTSDRDGFDEF